MINAMEFILVGANILAYAMIIVAISRRNNKFPKNVTLEQAFRILEESLKRSYPEIHDGFTWDEIIKRLKSSKRKTMQQDWAEIEKTLNKYEAFRYGGYSYENVDVRSVLRLAQKLPRYEEIAS